MESLDRTGYKKANQKHNTRTGLREEKRTVENETSNTMTVQHSLMLHPARTSIFSCYKRMLFLAPYMFIFFPSITPRKKECQLLCVLFATENTKFKRVISRMDGWMDERLNEQFHLVPVGQTNDSFG